MLLLLSCSCRATPALDGGVDAGTAADGGLLGDGGLANDGGQMDAGSDSDAGTPPDGGLSTPLEDPACTCGARDWSLGMRRFVCPCISIPATAFDCSQDSDCVRFNNTCLSCEAVPDIAVHRGWLSCLTAYRDEYCRVYGPFTVTGTCCPFCPRDDACRPRCVNNLCTVPILDTSFCQYSRDPDGGGYFAPYPYPRDGGPYAPCPR